MRFFLSPRFSRQKLTFYPISHKPFRNIAGNLATFSYRQNAEELGAWHACYTPLTGK